jgi:hypothetical protein
LSWFGWSFEHLAGSSAEEDDEEDEEEAERAAATQLPDRPRSTLVGMLAARRAGGATKFGKVKEKAGGAN